MKDPKFHFNAFWLLGATTRDNRRRIVELAEEKSLHMDHEVCQKARADLINPRTRLTAELNWFPGISPKKVDRLFRRMSEEPMSIRSEQEIPTLARANLMAEAMANFNDQSSTHEVSQYVQEFAQIVEEIDPHEILRDVNEDRLVSGFPEIKAIDLVEAELSELKKHYRKMVIDALDNMPPCKLIEAMTKVVSRATGGGRCQAPWLVDEVVDSYEVETQGFMQKEAENISKLLNAARDCAKGGEAIIDALIEKLNQVVRNWNMVAYPIQLSMKARGIEHQASAQMARKIRQLALDLWNSHGMLSQSQRITSLLQERFSELPELSETLEQDASAIESLFQNRRQAEARKEEWAQEITFQVEVGGLLNRHVLGISPDGIEWKGIKYPLESITHVRWGGIRYSSGLAYTIAFYCDDGEEVIELASEEIYSSFIDKLWRAVCVRLMSELLESVAAGKRIHFGEALVDNEGISLTEHTQYGDDKRSFCNWYQIEICSQNGSFWIRRTKGDKTYVELPYITTWNVHLLECIIRMAFKKGVQKLSDLLNGE